jgi:hypothetical protein
VITQDRLSEDAGLLTDSVEYVSMLSPARTLDPIEPALPAKAKAS